MQTITTTKIVSEIDRVQFGFWRQISEEEGEFVPLQSTVDFAKAAEYLGCSVELLEMLQMLHDEKLDALKMDLVSIWKRLDQIANVYQPSQEGG